MHESYKLQTLQDNACDDAIPDAAEPRSVLDIVSDQNITGRG
jgi:hypothetical protein